MTMKTGLIGRLPQGGGGHPGATAARPPPRRPDRQLDRADEPGLAIPELFERRGRPDQWRLQRCGSPDGDHDGVPTGIEVRIDLDLPVVRDPNVARGIDGTGRDAFNGVGLVARGGRYRIADLPSGRALLRLNAAEPGDTGRNDVEGSSVGFVGGLAPKLKTHTVSSPSTATPHGNVIPPPVNGDPG